MLFIERLIARSGDNNLVGGLVWRAASPAQHRVRALREAKALMPDASHYAQAKVGDQVRYGIYQPRALEVGVALPKGTLAAAACFAEKVGRSSHNAALVLTVPAVGHRREERLLVVCLEDGVPVIDVLSSETEARNALGVEDRPIWSDNPTAYPNCRAASFEWLVSDLHRQSRLARIPLNPWPAAAAIGCVASLLAGWAITEQVSSARRARQDAARAAEANPLPRYLSALQAMQSGMCADRSRVLQAVQSMFSYPLAVRGWMLVSEECSTAHRRCSTRWARKGGTFDDLRRALPDDELDGSGEGAIVAASLDSAVASRQWEPPRHPLGDRLHPLQSARLAFSSSASLLQAWRTAGVVLDFKGTAVWPKVPDMAASLRDPRVVVAGDVVMHDVPGPFILEALGEAPQFISWEDVRLEIDHSTDAKSALRFSATGVFYAMQ